MQLSPEEKHHRGKFVNVTGEKNRRMGQGQEGLAARVRGVDGWWDKESNHMINKSKRSTYFSWAQSTMRKLAVCHIYSSKITKES